MSTSTAKVIEASNRFRSEHRQTETDKHPVERISGKVKFFKKNEGYGFIFGEDGEEYYFNQYSLKDNAGEIISGQEVAFVPEISAKGTKAGTVTPKELLYEEPRAFIFSETEEIRGWDILESLGEFREQEANTISEAKMMLRNIAIAYGGNGIINLLITKEEKYSGNYCSSLYKASGIPVQIAKLSPIGTYELDDFRSMKNILNKVIKYKDYDGEIDKDVECVIEAEEKESSKKLRRDLSTLFWIIFAIFAIPFGFDILSRILT